MNPCVFEATTVLEAPIERVFAFHSDPRNISGIAPSWQQVRVIQAESAARTGEQFELDFAMLRLIRFHWRGKWSEVQSPTLLADDGLQAGPFAVWRHRHLFRSLAADRTEMTDHVTYLLRGGLLGKVATETFGRVQMRLMFADRHRRTRALFAAK